MKSTVAPWNRRIKGTEKFRNDEESESIRPMKADTLSDGDPLADPRHCLRNAGESGEIRESIAA